MRKEKFWNLKCGDIVQNVGSEVAYVVTGNYGEFLLVARTLAICNPKEWKKVKK